MGLEVTGAEWAGVLYLDTIYLQLLISHWHEMMVLLCARPDIELSGRFEMMYSYNFHEFSISVLCTAAHFYPFHSRLTSHLI